MTDPELDSPQPESERSTGPARLDRVLVIVPTYNESENIEWIVGRLRSAVPEADVLIADDNSPDGTGDLADRLAGSDDHVHVLHRQGKEGLGAAYLAGFRWGLDRGYDVLCEHDADGSHRPEDLPRLLAALAASDLVIGSRYVKGGRTINWPASRQLISRAGNVWIKVFLGMHVHDATGGFRAFRRATLEGIGLDDVASAGYCFQVDLTWRAVKAGFRVVEVPITFIERERGSSKMDRSIVLEALLRTTWWGIRYRAEQLAGRARRARESLPARD